MSKTYGYCRISRKEQNIERQERNIKAAYPDAIIIREAFTGTKREGRVKFEQLLEKVKPGDCIIFDSVSRMSRNAAEGLEDYERLYAAGVDLVFLKEHHVDTQTYKSALAQSVPMTGTDVDCILEGVNKYLRALRRKQIQQAFEQAEKEVKDLHDRTREGIETARLAGKQIGQTAGKTLNVKKAGPAKAAILKYSRDFNGTLNDSEVMKLAGISRNTLKKYRDELKAEGH